MRTTAFLDLLRSRRSRRFAKGMSIPAGPFAYHSAQEPQSLSRAETGILVMAAAGATGWSLGMPYTESGPDSAGANYPSRLTGRSYPSAAGVNSSELIVVDDDGVRVTRFRDITASGVDAFATVDFSDFSTLSDLVEDHLVPLTDQRPDLPRVPPAIAAHNRWNANRPGTTLFAPVTDMAEMLLGFLSIFTGEGVVLWDPASDSPIGDPTGLLAAGVLHEQAKMPWDAFESLVWKQGVVEGSLMAYNAQLAATSMGLGGWLYTGIDSAAFLGGYQPMGIDGLGFATTQPTTPGPLNATGIHGGFETLARPFVRDANEAVRRFDA